MQPSAVGQPLSSNKLYRTAFRPPCTERDAAQLCPQVSRKKKDRPVGDGPILSFSSCDHHRQQGRKGDRRQTTLLRGGLSRGLNGRLDRTLRSYDFTTAAAAVAATVAAVAAVATVAAVAAIAMARAAIFARAATTTVAAMTAAMAIRRAAAVAAAAARTEEQASLSLAVAADQGDPDQSEEQGHTEYNNAIHPKFLQLLTGTVS